MSDRTRVKPQPAWQRQFRTMDAHGNHVIEELTDEVGPDGQRISRQTIVKPAGALTSRPPSAKTPAQWAALRAKHPPGLRSAGRATGSPPNVAAATTTAAPAAHAGGTAATANDMHGGYDGHLGSPLSPPHHPPVTATPPQPKRRRTRRRVKPAQQANAELQESWRGMLPTWTQQYLVRRGIFPDSGGLHPCPHAGHVAELLVERAKLVLQALGCPTCGHKDSSKLVSLDSGAHIRGAAGSPQR
jgi:hypothetical protein